MMAENDRKATLQALHTAAVVKAVQCHERNVVLDGHPPPMSNSEKELTRKERSTLAQLRSGYCRLLCSYKSRIKKDANLDVCADCGTTHHDVKHLFVCPAHPTTLIPSDLWSRPTDAVRELSYLEARDPYWNEHGLKGEQQHSTDGDENAVEQWAESCNLTHVHNAKSHSTVQDTPQTSSLHHQALPTWKVCHGANSTHTSNLYAWSMTLLQNL